jgi:hypothetical protein
MTPNSSKWNAELSPGGPSLKVLVNQQEDKNGLVRSKFLRPRIQFTKQEDKNELVSRRTIRPIEPIIPTIEEYSELVSSPVNKLSRF